MAALAEIVSCVLEVTEVASGRFRPFFVKFGELPEGAFQRLRRASADDLDRWAERVLVAATLEEVIGDE